MCANQFAVHVWLLNGNYIYVKLYSSIVLCACNGSRLIRVHGLFERIIEHVEICYLSCVNQDAPVPILFSLLLLPAHDSARGRQAVLQGILMALDFFSGKEVRLAACNCWVEWPRGVIHLSSLRSTSGEPPETPKRGTPLTLTKGGVKFLQRPGGVDRNQDPR